jgi:GAF domain-containing protein
MTDDGIGGETPAAGLEQRLDLIGRATVAIAAERALPALLQRIVDAAREVTGARYGALGVAGEGGRLVEFITTGITAAVRVRIGPLPQGHGVLGVILRGTGVLRLPRIYEHPLSCGFPPHHPPMTSFLGAPILLRGRNLGNLYLTDKQGAEEFTEEDERLLLVLAAHAAVAIDGARLSEQTNEALSEWVRELAAANEQLQRLTSLVINLLELTAATVDGVRRLALDLRPSTLDDLGLVPAIESYAREFGERADIEVRVRIQGTGGRLPRERELMVYRIVQEALTNAAKHAGASAVEIELRTEGGHLVATVRDNGRGFAVDDVLAARERGLGLFGMQERAQLAGGYLDLHSTPGIGTTVTLVTPLHTSQHSSEGNGR